MTPLDYTNALSAFFLLSFFSPVHATKQTPDVSVCNTVPVHSVDRKQVENNILSFYSLCISK